MTPDVRREALDLIGEAWDLSPDVRLGQLLAHLGFLGDCHVGRGLGEIEDDELLAVLYRHRAELRARIPGTPENVPKSPSAATSVSGSALPTEAISAFAKQ